VDALQPTNALGLGMYDEDLTAYEKVVIEPIMFTPETSLWSERLPSANAIAVNLSAAYFRAWAAYS
jgi:hypothetical protein